MLSVAFLISGSSCQRARSAVSRPEWVALAASAALGQHALDLLHQGLRPRHAFGGLLDLGVLLPTGAVRGVLVEGAEVEFPADLLLQPIFASFEIGVGEYHLLSL